MERSVSEPPSSPWHATFESWVRLSPIAVGAGATAVGGIQPSVRLLLGLGLLIVMIGLFRLGANICVPISKAIGDGVALRVKRRLEGPSPDPGTEDS
ncbi:hypothetical protein DQ244_06530 [Blastococcus sp. TBT05-19]|nr:hypothetical protein DQ244_06530 [Blastococcus sp. TBT05-19]